MHSIKIQSATKAASIGNCILKKLELIVQENNDFFEKKKIKTTDIIKIEWENSILKFDFNIILPEFIKSKIETSLKNCYEIN